MTLEDRAERKVKAVSVEIVLGHRSPHRKFTSAGKVKARYSSSAIALVAGQGCHQLDREIRFFIYSPEPPNFSLAYN